MTLVKIEKVDCPACNLVGTHLDNLPASYKKWDIHGLDETSDKAREILGELGYFSVPVTVLLDEQGKVLDHVHGFKPEELDALVEKTK